MARAIFGAAAPAPSAVPAYTAPPLVPIWTPSIVHVPRIATAAELGLDADIVIPQEALRRLARGEPPAEVLAQPPVRAWQRERFGEALERELAALRGRR